MQWWFYFNMQKIISNFILHHKSLSIDAAKTVYNSPTIHDLFFLTPGFCFLCCSYILFFIKGT